MIRSRFIIEIISLIWVKFLCDLSLQIEKGKGRKMKKYLIIAYFFAASLLVPSVGHAIHIMEGFLPKKHAVFWLIVVLPVLFIGYRRIRAIVICHPEQKMLLGLAAAFIFVLWALKMPSITGASSHATGVGLSAVLFGPAVSTVLSGIVLVFQALLLAHGGITTWGANTFSMGVAGPFIAWGLFKVATTMGLLKKVAIFLAATVGDLTTYMVTAGQLALAFPDPVGGFLVAFVKFIGVFAITQIPLAVCEGLLSVVVYNTLVDYKEQGLTTLWGQDQGGKE